mmetsp:Transcript_19583/g.25687  ORF Transcript_19583/g.25687 Transcript_19583/m.25687 type:complete len:134 (-) Transcript_19583:259-660(-)
MPRILNRNSKLTFPRRNSLTSSSFGSSSSKSSRTESTCGTPDEVPRKAMRRYSAPSSHDLARSMKAADKKTSTTSSRIPRVPSDAWGHFVDVSKPLLRVGTHNNKRRTMQEPILHGDIDSPVEKNDSWLSFFR